MKQNGRRTDGIYRLRPRYQLRNRTTAVSSSSSHVLITSHANLPAIDGCMAEGRSLGEAAEASLVDPPLREMPQLSPILEVEQESQDTGSTEIYTPPLLQPDTISPYSRVALDTQTHNAQPIDISPQQPITSAVTLAYSHVASDTQTDSSQTDAIIQQMHL